MSTPVLQGLEDVDDLEGVDLSYWLQPITTNGESSWDPIYINFLFPI